MGYSFVRRKYHTDGTIYLPIGIMLAYLAIIYVHSLGLGFFVGRYLLPAVVLTMPIAAAVIAILAQATYHYLFDRQNLSKRQAYLLSTCVVLIIALPSLVSAARPNTSKALTILDAARWVKANSEPTDRIFTWERRIPFYAQRQAVQWNPWRFLGKDYRKTAFVVFFQTRGEQWIKDRFFKVLDGGKLPVPKLVKTFRQDHCYDVLVYRLPTRR